MLDFTKTFTDLVLRGGKTRFYSFLAILAGVLSFLPSAYSTQNFLLSLAMFSLFAGALVAGPCIKDGLRFNQKTRGAGWDTTHFAGIVAVIPLFLLSILMERYFDNFTSSGIPALDGTRLGLLWFGFYGGMLLQAYRFAPAVRLSNVASQVREAVC